MNSHPHRTSPHRLIRCSSFLAAKDHASTHSPCCASLNPIPQAAPTVRLKVSLRSMLSCLLLWLRHSSRQLLCPASSFVQSYSLHFISLRSLAPAHVHSVWVMILPALNAHNHKQTPFTSLPKLTPLHYVTLRTLSLSRAQYTRCHCCARLRCRSGCGLSCFLRHALLADTPPAPFNNQHTQAKNHASPCSVRASSPDACFCSRHFLIVRTALIRSSFVLLAHTLPPARGLSSWRPLRSP